MLVLTILKANLSNDNSFNVSNIQAGIRSGTNRIIRVKNLKTYKIFPDDSPIEFSVNTRKINRKLDKFLIPSIHLTKKFINIINNSKGDLRDYEQTEQSDQKEEIAMQKLKKDIIKQSIRNRKKGMP